MAYIEWRRGEGVVACRLDRGMIPTGDRVAGVAADGVGTGRPETVVVDPDGLLRKGVKAVKNLGGTAPALEKGVFVEMGTRALFFANGRYEGELAQGAYRLDKIERILEKQLHVYHPVVVLLDAAETWIDFEIHGKRTKDLQDADVFLQLALQLVDPELFLANLMKGGDAFTEKDLRVRLFQPLAQGVEQFVASRDGAELSHITDQTRDLMLAVLQGSCRDVLAAMGFALVRVNVFNTDVALDNARTANAARRARERAELADDMAQAEVDAERLEWGLQQSRDEYRRRKAQEDAERQQKRGDAEDGLEDRDWQADYDDRSDARDLTDTRRRIDMWARFADETLRKEVLEKGHVLELQEQLAKIHQEYRQLGVIRDEEWRKVQDEVDWAHLEADWDRQDRLATRQDKEEQQRRQRKHILVLLDMKLAKELQQTQLRDSSDIIRLKLELACCQIEEKLELDKVEERAKQELGQVLFGGQRDAAARGQELTEQSLTFQQRTEGMKRVLQSDELKYEVEVNQLQTEITLAAMDREEAVNLLAKITQEGEKGAVSHGLEITALKLAAALQRRDDEFQQELKEREDAARLGNEINVATADAEAQAEWSAAEVRHRIETAKLERKRAELQMEIEAAQENKLNKVIVLQKLSEIDEAMEQAVHRRKMDLKELDHRHDLGRRGAELDKTRVTLEHEAGIKRQETEVRIRELEAEERLNEVRATMSPEQLDALLGNELARIASYKVEEKEAVIAALEKANVELEAARASGDERYEKVLQDQQAGFERFFDKHRTDINRAMDTVKEVSMKAMEETRRTAEAGFGKTHGDADELADLQGRRVDDAKEARTETVGAVVGAARPAEKETVLTECKQCGHPMGPDDVFCSKCAWKK